MSITYNIQAMALPRSADLLRGTLDLLILRALSLEPLHGWGVSERIQQLSGSALSVGQGSLYPALQKLENWGWIEGKWGLTAEGRRARYYTLTRKGERALDTELESWRKHVGAVELVLGLR
jgi:transcriptional regulator